MKVIIAGSRGIQNYALVQRIIAESGFTITEVVSGRCRGVDQLGEQWAIDHSIPVQPFPAAWDDVDAPGAMVRYRRNGTAYNALAGFWRNQEMAEYANALIAIRRNGSTGTTDMIQRMAGKLMHVVDVDDGSR